MALFLEEEQPLVGSGQGIPSGPFTKIAGTWSASASYDLNTIGLHMGIASAPQIVPAAIYSTNGGLPNVLLKAFDITVTGSVAVPDWVIAQLPSDLTLSSGTLYAIVIDGSGFSVGTGPTTFGNAGATDGEDEFIYSSGGGWVFNTGRKFGFQMYSGYAFNPPLPSRHPVTDNITGSNGIVTISRLVACSNNKVYYET